MNLFRRIHDWFVDRLAALREPVKAMPMTSLTEQQAREKARSLWGLTGDVRRWGNVYEVGTRAVPSDIEPPLIFAARGAGTSYEAAFADAIAQGW